MPRASKLIRCAVVGAILSIAVSGSVRAALISSEPETPTEVIEAEAVIRLAAEEAAARIQRSVSASVNTIMGRRPATSFNLRNAVRAGQNAVNAASRAARARFAQVVVEVIDELDAGDTSIIDIIRLSEQYDTEIDDNLRDLTDEGVRDLTSLVRNGRRTNSVRGTFVGRYELFVSQPENGREAVKIGEVMLGESQMIRGPIETDAVLDFFLEGMAVPTPRVHDLPGYAVLKAVRWLSRAGAMIVSNDDARVSQLVPVDAREFSITGIDLLPERLRFELELLLEDTIDVTTNPEGVDGFFRSFTYTFRRVVEAE